MKKESFSKLRQYILSQQWYHKGFEGSTFPLYQWQALAGYYRECGKKQFPARLRESVTISSVGQCSWFWNQRDLEEIRRWFLREIEKDAKFPQKIIARWRKELILTTAWFKRFESLSLKNLSDRELADTFDMFYADYIRSAAYAALNEGFSLGAEKWIKEMLRAFLNKKGLELKTPEYFSLLSQAVLPSFIQEALILKKKGLAPKQLAKNFFWIHFNYLHTTPLTAAYFKKMKVEHLVNFGEVKKKKRALMQKLAMPQGLRRIFTTAEQFTWWQDQRKKNALIANYWMFKFLREAGRRNNIAGDQLLLTAAPEFRMLALRDKKFLKELQARKSPVLCYVPDDGSMTIISGPKASAILESLTTPKSTELRGTPTFSGRVKGRVVLLLGTEDMKRVKKGDILVASMTRPEFTPVLRMAAAIVTDEGGIACHASIISREFKTPCVIGTKNATKLLYEGDLVEVDAVHGVVRKIG